MSAGLVDSLETALHYKLDSVEATKNVKMTSNVRKPIMLTFSATREDVLSRDAGRTGTVLNWAVPGMAIAILAKTEVLGIESVVIKTRSVGLWANPMNARVNVENVHQIKNVKRLEMVISASVKMDT